ncbi:MAG: PhzF family phenazine biosynthesis protein [Deltaproteobacteria bacterium]|nr:PhzF family phenazine biosynthesis protein [Candidatus Zymogenaceae bacterium]
MIRLRFHILDVFAEKKYAGNQLAVVESFGALNDDAMLDISREFNFSETTFIQAREPGENGWPVRIFTPAGEVPFAGHPTLGTAWIIREELLKGTSEEIVLDLFAGTIPVTFRGDDAEMTQLPPVFGSRVDHAGAAEVLGIDESDIRVDLPIQIVSTGLPFLITPLADLDAVARCRVDTPLLRDFVKDLDAKLFFVFTDHAEHSENQIRARMFGHYYDVPEDPATGSAAGCLAGYLKKHAVLGEGEVFARIEQGFEMGRPSILTISAREEGGEMLIRVAGRVIKTAEGFLT